MKNQMVGRKKLKLEGIENFEGNFNQKKISDQQFEECTNIFTECITLLSNSDDHINTYRYLQITTQRLSTREYIDCLYQ